MPFEASEKFAEEINKWNRLIFAKKFVIINEKKWWPVKTFLDTRQHFFVWFFNGNDKMKVTFMRTGDKWSSNKKYDIIIPAE